MILANKILSLIPEPLRYTLMLRAFGFFQVPLIFAVRPSIICLDDEKCVIKTAFRRKVKNHLGSIYFGALAIAAECAGGVAVMKEIKDSNEKISLVFKDFHADFLKRVEGDAYFTCSDIPAIKTFVESVKNSSERKEMTFDVIATCPDKFGDEAVAKFSVTVSLKKSTRK
ncbi:MAG: PaaI family thioesterase [Cellvibrionaceae bacterium]